MFRTLGGDFRPDVQNISSNIISLDYLIRQYPRQQVIPQFKKLQLQYPFYRAIRGDGNCFYRAIAFLYLRQVNLQQFSNVFQRIPNYCQNYPLQFEGQTFQDQLQKIYLNYLKPLVNIYQKQRQTKLIEIFNNSIIFDTVLILYFRSLNYIYIQRNKTSFRQYITNQDVIEKIRQFKNESEGVEYLFMAMALNISIKINITGRYELKTESYNQKINLPSYDLFFRSEHIDVLYHKNSPYLKKITRNSNSRQQADIMNRNHREIPSESNQIKSQRDAFYTSVHRSEIRQKELPFIPPTKRPDIFEPNHILQNTSNHNQSLQNQRKKQIKGDLNNLSNSRIKQNPFESMSKLRHKDSSSAVKVQTNQNNQLIPSQQVKHKQRLKQYQAFNKQKIQKIPYSAWQKTNGSQGQNSRKYKQMAIMATFVIFLILIGLKL